MDCRSSLIYQAKVWFAVYVLIDVQFHFVQFVFAVCHIARSSFRGLKRKSAAGGIIGVGCRV